MLIKDKIQIDIFINAMMFGFPFNAIVYVKRWMESWTSRENSIDLKFLGERRLNLMNQTKIEWCCQGRPETVFYSAV